MPGEPILEKVQQEIDVKALAFEMPWLQLSPSAKTDMPSVDLYRCTVVHRYTVLPMSLEE